VKSVRVIVVQNLHKSFGTKSIIRDFSYNFPKGKNVAIVGANGAGKTTFLNMICGKEEIDSGNIFIPKECTLAYLPQSPSENPEKTILAECVSGHKKLFGLYNSLSDSLKKMEENYSEAIYEEYENIEKQFSYLGGYSLESDSKEILSGLGFSNEQFNESPLSLSGGWRMRLELAKILINSPNFLILDEPTNHLDLPSLTWFEQYLKSFTGTLLFVSHDRDFLNNISDITINISNGNVTVYHGNFDDFIGQRDESRKQTQKQLDNIKKKKDSLQEFVDRFRAKASKAKQAQSKLKVIEKLQEIENRLDIDESDKKINFKIEIEKQSSKIVLDISNASIGYGSKVLQKDINLKIIRGNKIAIIGQNGLGKSTLLKSILGEIQFLSGEINSGTNVSIGYFSQNQTDSLDGSLDALENVLRSAPNVTHQQARSILGCLLMTKNDVKKSLRVLSGGEKSKVAIAILLAKKYNFLLLDEPTNHLDMSSIEALGSSLSEYMGTVLMVSHNRSFISSFSTHIFKMEAFSKPELFGVE
jgi:ATP-binding cassette subfamily F protein 3